MVSALMEYIPDTIANMMAGHASPSHSTQVLAAFSLAGLVRLLLVMGLINGVSAALDTLCSQAFGAMRFAMMWMFCQAGLLLYGMALPALCLVLWTSGAGLELLGQNADIARTAGHVLAITTVALPFAIIYTVMKSGLQAQNIALPFVLCDLASFVVSTSAAYVLAFKFGLGYMGVALAAPTSWLVKSLVLVPFLLRNSAFCQAWPGWQLREALVLVPKIWKLGASGVLMVTFQTLGFAILTFMAGLLPSASTAISACGIFSALVVILSMPLLGFCVAGAVRIGNALGAGDARRAATIARIVLTATTIVSAIDAVLLATVSGTFARSYTSNTATIAMVSRLGQNLVPLMPLISFTFGLQAVLRGCGKQFLCAQLNFVCLFVLGAPVGALFALHQQLGLLGLWYGNLVGLTVFLIIGLAWFHRLSWDDMAQLAQRNAHLRSPAVAEDMPSDAC
ncbi:TPA: hypothetical protein N0F65_002288 [Lagenidium giganteum]|uniref:Multidrug resistance protein NorM n=1 Tax=Lagenidium giganteum TaxID=4803 RepID=A0AAV2Z1D4_9STRA|nr:TPA: hypothetical protein N0F65_002288 [Lagenidium giganteum]